MTKGEAQRRRWTFYEAVNIRTQSNACHHLGWWRDCGLVTAEERRRFVQHESSDKRLRQVLRLADKLWAGVAKGGYQSTRCNTLT